MGTQKGIVAIGIIAAFAFVLAVLAVGFAAPASAVGGHRGGAHHGGAHGHHSAAGHPHPARPPAVGHRHQAHGSANRESHAAATAQSRAVVDGAQGTGEAKRLPPRGHDKCVKLKGGRGFPPWCTDPAEGRLGSVTHRAQPDYPAAAIAHQAHRQRRVPVTSVEGPRPGTRSHR